MPSFDSISWNRLPFHSGLLPKVKVVWQRRYLWRLLRNVDPLHVEQSDLDLHREQHLEVLIGLSRRHPASQKRRYPVRPVVEALLVRRDKVEVVSTVIPLKGEAEVVLGVAVARAAIFAHDMRAVGANEELAHLGDLQLPREVI
jgi:hypothetical protein